GLERETGVEPATLSLGRLNSLIRFRRLTLIRSVSDVLTAHFARPLDFVPLAIYSSSTLDAPSLALRHSCAFRARRLNRDGNRNSPQHPDARRRGAATVAVSAAAPTSPSARPWRARASGTAGSRREGRSRSRSRVPRIQVPCSSRIGSGR